MASSDSDHTALLDQLQAQVNLILEQTGRVFAAMATYPKERPTAQLTKLKSTFPVASSQFHETLDQLENELQLANMVMRRDLALCYERSGVHVKQKEVQPLPIPDQKPQSPPQAQESIEAEQEPVPQPDVDNIVAVSAIGTTSSSTAKPEAVGAWVNALPASTNKLDDANSEPPKPAVDEDMVMFDLPEPTTESPAIDSKPAAEASAPPLADAKPSIVAHTLPLNEPNLQVDTKPAAAEETTQPDSKPTEDEKAPDTANDLDSLFNDPMSAGGGAGENTDFNFDQDGSGAFDFGPFDAGGADNDNISSLLPGLEDYAHTQSNPGGDMDFNALFNVTGDGGNDGMNSQGAGEQRDTTFDDLMDLANFDGGAMEGDGSGNTNNQDFDFDSLFN